MFMNYLQPTAWFFPIDLWILGGGDSLSAYLSVLRIVSLYIIFLQMTVNSILRAHIMYKIKQIKLLRNIFLSQITTSYNISGSVDHLRPLYAKMPHVSESVVLCIETKGQHPIQVTVQV